MRLKPFFSYYGSKHRIAGLYPEPQTGRIIEPFAGGAAYACRYAHLDVLLIDTNFKLIGAWDYIIKTPKQEIGRLKILGPDETVEDLGVVPQEAKWLVGWWLNQGTPSPCNRFSAWGKQRYGENRCGFWGEKIRRRLSHQSERVRHWKTLCGNYWQSPDIEADWFVDPPYQGRAGSHYGPHGSKGFDFAALATWCRERRGQTVVCENEGAKWLPFVPFHRAAGMRGLHRTGVSHEAIWHRPLLPTKQGELALFA